MSNFANVKRYTKIMNGRECNFRSIFEYHWAEYCQLRKDNGEIEDWYYEEETVQIEYIDHKNRVHYKDYTPDFKIVYPGGDHIEFEETKGWLQTKDATKMRKYSEQYETPLVVVFQNKMYKKQQRTAERLSKHVQVIWEAEKYILKPIKHLFDV